MASLADVRRFYAEEIRAVGNLRSDALVEALATVPREDYLGAGPWDIATADMRRPGAVTYRRTPDADPRHIYHNILVAIDATRELNNGHPQTLASCLDALWLRPGETFVHIGCGVGYYTALAATMVGPGGQVRAIEIDEPLAARAAANLRHFPHVTAGKGDGATNELPKADAILVNAGFTHPLDAWLDALNECGRLLVPITGSIPNTPIGAGWTLLITRDGDRYRAQSISPIAIFISPSGRDETLSLTIRQNAATGGWLRIKSARRGPHEKTESCAVHAASVCLSFDEV